MRHVLTMAIGVSGALTIRYYVIRMQPAALLMICSDGLHGVVDATKIESILREAQAGSGTLEDKCRSLIQAAKEAGAPDNVTCILVRQPDNWPSAADHR